MILESVQMLYCAHWIISNGHFSRDDNLVSYKKTHQNHPCNIWLRESFENYKWLCFHTKELCKEYTRRYNKIHKSQSHLKWLMENNPCPKNVKFTVPPQAMPDKYKVILDKPSIEATVMAYRRYYKGDKEEIAKWKLGNIPKWFKSSN